jgi:cell division protein FtsB
MSSVRGRRGASPADGRRAARPARTAATGPVRGLSTRRPGQRSAARRAARAPLGTTPEVRRRPLVTGRAVLLVALVLLLALTLAGPVRQYLAGRAELVRLAAEGEALEQRATDLEDQLARQADPAWTEREARERLTYVLPGDRLVVVVDGESRGEEPGPLSPLPGSAPGRPWYEGLLESVEVADGDRPAAADGDRPAAADGDRPAAPVVDPAQEEPPG